MNIFFLELNMEIFRLIFCLQNEEKLKEALKFANACGALCTTQKGAIPAIPSRDEANALISGK